MPAHIIPPLYLLHTNFGYSLSSYLSSSASAPNTPNDSLFNRLLAEGVMGVNPALLLENHTYYNNVLSIVNDRLAQSDLENSLARQDKSSVNKGAEVESESEVLEEDVDNSHDDELEKDDGFLLDNDSTLVLKNHKLLHPSDPISSILIQNLNNKYSGYPLPTRWLPANNAQKKLLVTGTEENKKEEFLKFSDDGLAIHAVSYNKFGSVTPRQPESVTFLLKSNNYVPYNCGIFYFEVKINSDIKHYNFSIGFAKSSSVYVSKVDPSQVNSDISFDELPGVAEFTYGFNGQLGTVSYFNTGSKQYGTKFGSNDIIGCGINFYDDTIFYTKNGQYLGVAFEDVDCEYAVPIIGFNSSYDEGHAKSQLNSVRSLTNSVYLNRPQEDAAPGFQSFGDSLDKFNNNYVLHDLHTNFGFTVKHQDGIITGPKETFSKFSESVSRNFYFDINGYISSLKTKIFTKMNKSNLLLGKNWESSINFETQKQNKQVTEKKTSSEKFESKNISISSLLNSDKKPDTATSLTDSTLQEEKETATNFFTALRSIPRQLPSTKDQLPFSNSTSSDTAHQDSKLISQDIDRSASNNKLILKDVECKTVINKLIKNYFEHLGYVNSKIAFMNDLDNESQLSGYDSKEQSKSNDTDVQMTDVSSEKESSEGLEIEETQQSTEIGNKQIIRNYILNGEINLLLKFLETNYNAFFNITELDYTSDYQKFSKIKDDKQDTVARDLVFELKCVKLIKLIKDCIESENDSRYVDEAIDFSKFLIKQYSDSKYKVNLLNDLFKLLITSNSKTWNKPDNDHDDDSIEDEYTEDAPIKLLSEEAIEFANLREATTDSTNSDKTLTPDEGPIASYDSKHKRSFEHLLKSRNFKNLKLKITDRLNSFILRKLGKSSISDLEKIVNLTNSYLEQINDNDLNKDVLFINLNKDILR